MPVSCPLTFARFAVVFVVLACSLSLPKTSWAQGLLENPRPGSIQSGVGLVSGWKCQANRVEIAFDDDPPVLAAYGTVREDTATVCGDIDNGFGLLFNWNQLGDGPHTVHILADGVEFGSSTFTVVTLGEEFLEGAHKDSTLKNFPLAGDEVRLQWQESLQNFVISKSTVRQSQSVLPLTTTNASTASAPQGILENPHDKSFASGISVISGWVCDAHSVDVEIDGKTTLRAGYGTERLDTADVCGNEGNNGFGLLFNWNQIADGTHTIRTLADGVEFSSATFTVTTLEKEFVTGVSKTVLLENFPQGGSNITLQWEQPIQNFVITNASGAKCGGTVPCSCGDTVQQSTTLDVDIGPCPGVGLNVADGVVLDCAGHTITGTNEQGAWFGIVVSGTTNSEVRNCRVTKFRRGLRIRGGQGNRLINNESFLNRYGIDLADATTGNLIQGNFIHDNRDEGIHAGTGATNNEIRQNNFKKNKLENIYLLYADNNTITDNTSTQSRNTAIYIKHSSNNYVANNTTGDTPIHLRGNSVGNTLENNHLTGNGYFFDAYEDPPGVWSAPHDNHIMGGSVRDAEVCLHFHGAYDNVVDQLQIANCIPVELSPLGGREATGNVINTIPSP